MTLAPIKPGYTPPSEPELHFTCPNCGTKDLLWYRQRGEQVTRITLDGSVSASKPWLRMWGNAHLVCGNCQHPVGERGPIHDAVMAHMKGN